MSVLTEELAHQLSGFWVRLLRTAVENLVVTVGTVGNSVTSPRLRDKEAGVRATEEILVGN